MRIVKLGAVAGLVLALAACPAERDTPDVAVDDPVTRPAVEEPRTDPAMQPPAGAQQAQLEAVAGSGVTGEVHATPGDNRTDVMVMLRGAQPNQSYGARIMSGTCENPGVELARLGALGTDNTGQAHSQTDVGHAPNLIMDGNHVLAVYAPGTEPERDRPVSCATLPRATGTTM